MITVENIIKVSSYLTKIHHVKGRIRVRVSSKIKEEATQNGITLEDIQSLPNKINGIENIKINKAVGSITIKYDNSVFPYELWEDLLAQRNIEQISDILNRLQKEVV